MGITGGPRQARPMNCKFVDAQGQGSLSDAITAMDHARAKGARVINAGWATTISLPSPCAPP
ncbi:MAG: hypothetical protein HY302_08735 [Opitutae bacterium]|nr:hypothetical protein [Opitutae bacterium]